MYKRQLAIDGHADPNTASAYADALATLYPVTYALKFLSTVSYTHLTLPTSDLV